MKRLLMTLAILFGAMLQSFAQDSSWQSTGSYISASRGVYISEYSDSYGDSYSFSYTTLLSDDVGYSCGLTYVDNFDYTTDIVKVPLGVKYSFNYVQRGHHQQAVPATRYVVDRNTQQVTKISSPINFEGFLGIVPLYIFDDASTFNTSYGPSDANALTVESPFGIALEAMLGISVRFGRVKVFTDFGFDYYLFQNFSNGAYRRESYNYHVQCSVGVSYML